MCLLIRTICGISLIVYRGDLYHKALAIYDKRSVTLHPKTNIYIYTIKFKIIIPRLPPMAVALPHKNILFLHDQANKLTIIELLLFLYNIDGNLVYTIPWLTNPGDGL